MPPLSSHCCPCPHFMTHETKHGEGEYPGPHRCVGTGQPSTSPLASPSHPRCVFKGLAQTGARAARPGCMRSTGKGVQRHPECCHKVPACPVGAGGPRGRLRPAVLHMETPEEASQGASASHGSRHGASEEARVSGGHKCLEQGGEGDGLPRGWRRPTGGVRPTGGLLTWNGPGPAPCARRE